MSASKKKTTTKATKSPAPATKSAAAKPAARAKPAAKTVRTETATPVAMLAPPPEPKPALKAVVAKPIVTTVSAKIDIGFGNVLYVRGEGSGLSWDKGIAMDCLDNDHWQIVLAESARAYTFKFLVNDLSWSTGPDFTAACGTNVTVTPEF